jgi:hypothetical protein
MKVVSKEAGSMDGTLVKQPVVGWVTRYTSMIKSRSLNKQGSEPLVEAERPKVSLRLEDRQEALAKFNAAYEDFVEVVCDAAQFGISHAFERRYQNSRRDLVDQYATVRIFLSAYLRASGEDSRGAARGIRFDAFDSLLAPASLELFLQSDDGNTISRITRTREALNLYAEHLRQLNLKTR